MLGAITRVRTRMLGFGFFAAGLTGAMVLSSRPAEAVPAFAAQTGQPCVACHIGAFGPQLTPLGRAFKIGGYTQSGGEGWRSQIPLSVMAMGSFTNLSKDLPQDSVAHRYANNNNFNIDQVSLFVAGGFGEHTGIFSQVVTATDNFSAANMDNTDFRPYTTTFDVGDEEVRVGLSINNNPTVQDPYNSSFVWGYPFNSPSDAVAPKPAPGVMLANGFNENSIGVTAYLWYDKSLYLEAGVYKSQSSWLLKRFGETYDLGAIQGAAPYLRAAYEWNWDQYSAHIGGIFMHANVNPVDPTVTLGTTSAFGRNNFTDVTIDGGFQFLGDGTHVATLLANYTHEWQDFAGSAAMVNADQGTSFGNSYSLNQIQVAVSYWYRNTYGMTLGYQYDWGPANPVLYQPDPVGGSNNTKPNSNAFIFEADWVPFGKEDSWARPFANLKIGLQYYAYTRFNGSNQNYDGFGRTAHNNNTLYLFAWQAF